MVLDAERLDFRSKLVENVLSEYSRNILFGMGLIFLRHFHYGDFLYPLLNLCPSSVSQMFPVEIGD